jgi:hypothetical protein
MASTSSEVGTRRSGHNLLGIYLNDHLAGSTAGTELARRVAASAQHDLRVRAADRLYPAPAG